MTVLRFPKPPSKGATCIYTLVSRQCAKLGLDWSCSIEDATGLFAATAYRGRVPKARRRGDDSDLAMRRLLAELLILECE